MVHVSSRKASLDNLNLGLSEGRWAFPPTVRSGDLDLLEIGDLVIFGWGAGPRDGDQFSGWQSRRLTELHITRVTRLPFENTELFWLDERRHQTLRYNPTIEIELLRTIDDVPLAAGDALSFEASNALYRGGVSHKAMRVSTAGSPLLELEELPSSVLRPELIGRRSAAQEPAPRNRSRSRVVAIESPRVTRALVKAQAATTADPAESRLVHAYADHLRTRGDQVGRLLIPLPDGETIYSDLFCSNRRLLVEAKAVASRNNIRTAIGQLFDYGRHCDDASRAVLVPEQPSDDLLDLLSLAGIDAIWRQRSGFADTRDGLYC